MADTRRVSQPSQGSQDVGSETPDARGTVASASGAGDTQLHMAAKSKKHNKDTTNETNDDEKVLKNGSDDDEWLSNDETDE